MGWIEEANKRMILREKDRKRWKNMTVKVLYSELEMEIDGVKRSYIQDCIRIKTEGLQTY